MCASIFEYDECIFSSCTKMKIQNPDLDFMYTTIMDHHPGIYNLQDPNFKNNLDSAYRKSKEFFAQTDDVNVEKKILEDFARSFDDPHLWIHWYSNEELVPTSNQIVPSLEVNLLKDQVVWVALPTFDFNAAEQKEFQNLLKVLPKLRNKKIIIFDLRGNQGGNSEQGSLIINHLFGEKYAEEKRNEARSSITVDWRATPDNLSHINLIYERYQSSYFKDIVEGIKQSIRQNKPYYHEISSQVMTDGSKAAHTVKANIIVVIDSKNISAALDFIDELKMMGPRVKLIGQKTRADRLYMEVRAVSLPSGLGTFSFPIKVYRNRARKDNESYFPDLESQTTDTEKLLEFIL